MALDLVDEPDEVQLQEATLRPLQLAQGPGPCRSSAIAVRARARAAALQRKVSQEPGGGHGGQQGTPARHSIKGCSPTVPEEEEQSRAGDSEQGWPWLVTAGHRER